MKQCSLVLVIKAKKALAGGKKKKKKSFNQTHWASDLLQRGLRQDCSAGMSVSLTVSGVFFFLTEPCGNVYNGDEVTARNVDQVERNMSSYMQFDSHHNPLWHAPLP